MDSLRIETAQNGFLVYEGDLRNTGMLGKTWAFETALSLADFILEWGRENSDSHDMKQAKKEVKDGI